MSSILIKNVTIADESSENNGQSLDVYIENNIIKKIGLTLNLDADQIIDGKDQFLSPAWVSLMADFSEPGYEHKETISSGLDAAAAGGFGSVFIVPNTKPAIASKSIVEFVQKVASGHAVSLKVLGALSQDLEGKNLAEMMEMYDAGAIAFTDGWKPIQHVGLLQKALEYVKSIDGLVVQIPVLASLSDGLMNEGVNSVRFGMAGIPTISESLMVHRDIELARYTQSKIHFSGITTAASLALIQAAKAEGLSVSCSVTPYHLYFTDDALVAYNSLFKVDPPLRTEADRQALIAALSDGTIDCIAIHHKPQDWDAKVKEFEYASSGMASIEVAWPMLLAAAPKVSATQWANLLHHNIQKIFGLEANGIKEGASGPFTLFDQHTHWQLSLQSAKSKAFNIPLLDQPLTGKSYII